MPKHTQAERLAVAAMAGALSYQCKRVREGATSVDQAAAEIRAISTDPHLLAHAYLAPHEVGDGLRRSIAVAAGVDVEEALQIHAPRPRAIGGQLGRD